MSSKCVRTEKSMRLHLPNVSYPCMSLGPGAQTSGAGDMGFRDLLHGQGLELPACRLQG